MWSRIRQVSAIVGTAVLISGCGGASTSTSGGAGVAWGPPYTADLQWGKFTLSPKIVDKLKNRQAINYLAEGQAAGLPVISKIFYDGLQSGLTKAQKIYPLHFSFYAPPGNAYNQSLQISQIQAQLNAGQIDCLSVVPTTSDGLNSLIAQMVDSGIPVFTQGVPTEGTHDFANYAQVPLKEGKQAAGVLLQWMKDNNKALKVFAVTSALPEQVWAQGRMKSFVETIKAAIPDATFINDQTSALNTTLDPAATYDKARAFLTGNKSVQVVMNTDIGAEHIDRAIEDLGLAGKVYTIGWNVSKANLGYIDKGTQIATMDQNIPGQAEFGPTACATFMQTGKVLPNTLTLKPVLKADVASALNDLG